ncbi:MAG: hypothetical protein HKL96_02895 [Phycisphaerales bacterium]|nr:hypothetical protein [Phycisphaerales bacterium]
MVNHTQLRLTLCAVIVSVASAASPGPADTITLTDGRVIHGSMQRVGHLMELQPYTGKPAFVNPDDIASVVLGPVPDIQKRGAAVGAPTTLPSATSPAAAAGLTFQAIGMVRQERYLPAQKLLQHVLAVHRHNVPALIASGVIADRQKHLSGAMIYLTRALAAAPESVTALTDMAVLQHQRRLNWLACNTYARALALHPRRHQVYDNIFSLLHEIGRSRKLAFTKLKASFATADATEQQHMARRGLARVGATWQTQSQAQALAPAVMHYRFLRDNLVSLYASTSEQLAIVDRQIGQLQAEVNAAGGAVTVNPFGLNAGTQRSQLAADQYALNNAENRASQLRAALRQDRLQWKQLCLTPIGQDYIPPEQMLLPRRTKLSDKLSVAAMAHAPPLAGAGAKVIIAAAADRYDATLAQARRAYRRRCRALWADVITADKVEHAALMAATQAAMKADDVNGVVASDKLAKAVAQRLASEELLSDFDPMFTGAGDPTQDKFVRSCATVRNNAVAIILAKKIQAGQAIMQALQDADAARVRSLQAATQAAMKTGNADEVVQLADAVKQAEAQQRADEVAASSPAHSAATGSGVFTPGLPATSFAGVSTSGSRIVWIIDHEGDMLENFSFLKAELRHGLARLMPDQSFAVIVFRKNYTILGPLRLVHATTKNKARFYQRLTQVLPHGRAEYRFDRFYKPFKAAFKLHPQVIYFLTSGAFDPRLIPAVKRLNRSHRVHIFTFAFTNNDPTFIKNLKLLASQNGGQYRYISRADAGG